MRNYNTEYSLRNIALVFIVAALASCQVLEPTGYRVTTQNVPLLEEGGEVQAHGACGFNHVEGVFAISPINHVGIIGSSYINIDGGKTEEIGLGGYHKFENGFLIEGYASVGRSHFSAVSDVLGDGNLDISSDYRTRSTNDFKYSNRSIQLNFGYLREFGNFSISTKLTRANYDFYIYSKEVYSEGLMENPHVVESYLYNSFDNKRYNLLTVAPTYSYKQGLFYFQTQLVFANFIGSEKPFEPSGKFVPKAIWSTSIGLDIKTREWLKERKTSRTM